MRHLTASVAFSPDHQHTFILQRTLLVRPVHKLRKGGMTLNNELRIQGDLKFLTYFCHSLCFVFSTTIGQQEEWDVLFLEKG